MDINVVNLMSVRQDGGVLLDEVFQNLRVRSVQLPELVGQARVAVLDLLGLQHVAAFRAPGNMALL